MTGRKLAIVLFSLLTLTLAIATYRTYQKGRELRSLTKALRGQRLIEPKLSGSSTYLPCLSTEDSEPLRCAERRANPVPWARLHRSPSSPGEGEPSPETLQARGRLSLLFRDDPSDLRKAIRLLELAAAAKPGDGAVQNDLGVAELMLGRAESQPWHLVRALSSFQRSLADDPSERSALFNLAMTQELLGLRNGARSSWLSYLAAEESSGWTAEAEDHLARTMAVPARKSWQAALADLETAAPANRRALVSERVAAFPQEARRYTTENLLGRWGRLTLAGRRDEARALLDGARTFGEALRLFRGDRTAIDAVSAIDAARERGEGALREIASAQVEYSEATDLYSDSKESAPQLQRATADLLRSGSPLSLETEARAASLHYQAGQKAQAISTLDRLLPRSAPYPSIAGRVQWYRGLVEAKEGRLGIALAYYKRAFSSFSAIGEEENRGALEELIAEDLGLLGDAVESWSWRSRALATLGGHPKSRRLHNLLRDSADQVLEGGEPLAALSFQDEGIAVARRSGDAGMLAEAYLWRSHIQTRLGRFEAAEKDLTAARTHASSVRRTAERLKLRSDALVAAAGLAVRKDRAAQALTLLDIAILDYRRADANIDLAPALAARAAVELELGKERDAERDQAEALDWQERQRSGLSDRSSSSASIRAAFDRMISFQIERLGAPWKALAYCERARRMSRSPLPNRLELPAPREIRASIPDDAVVVEYAVAADHLYTWTLSKKRGTFGNRPISAQDFAADVHRLETLVASGRSRAEIRAVSERLYEILVPASVRALPPETTLFFVPDEAFAGLPFSALIDSRSERFLIEDRPIAVLPSLGFALDRWSRRRAAPRAWRATVVGNPTIDRSLFPDLADLPDAEREAAEIAKGYPSPRFLENGEASPKTILEGLERCEVFHFAGHAIADDSHPELSFLVAAPGPDWPSGVLRAQDFAGRIFPDLRTVILAACGTLHPHGGAVQGFGPLADVFLESGASSVVGSLSNVDDRRTRGLLTAFHSALVRDHDAARALRAAQLSVRHGSGDPMYSSVDWASWQVYGIP